MLQRASGSTGHVYSSVQRSLLPLASHACSMESPVQQDGTSSDASAGACQVLSDKLQRRQSRKGADEPNQAAPSSDQVAGPGRRRGSCALLPVPKRADDSVAAIPPVSSYSTTPSDVTRHFRRSAGCATEPQFRETSGAARRNALAGGRGGVGFEALLLDEALRSEADDLGSHLDRQ